MKLISKQNKDAKVVLVGIIPRLGDLQLSSDLVSKINDLYTDWWLEHSLERIFVPSASFFKVTDGTLNPNFYFKDLIHLSFPSGMNRIKQCLRKGMSDHNSKKGGHYKVAKPEQVRKRKLNGNLVVF